MMSSSQYKSIGQADWLFKCAEGEEVAVQSIFLTTHSLKAAKLPAIRTEGELLDNCQRATALWHQYAGHLI